jgi:hypothetical protein
LIHIAGFETPSQSLAEIHLVKWKRNIMCPITTPCRGRHHVSLARGRRSQAAAYKVEEAAAGVFNGLEEPHSCQVLKKLFEACCRASCESFSSNSGQRQPCSLMLQ